MSDFLWTLAERATASGARIHPRPGPPIGPQGPFEAPASPPETWSATPAEPRTAHPQPDDQDDGSLRGDREVPDHRDPDAQVLRVAAQQQPVVPPTPSSAVSAPQASTVQAPVGAAALPGPPPVVHAAPPGVVQRKAVPAPGGVLRDAEAPRPTREPAVSSVLSPELPEDGDLPAPSPRVRRPRRLPASGSTAPRAIHRGPAPHRTQPGVTPSPVVKASVPTAASGLADRAPVERLAALVRPSLTVPTLAPPPPVPAPVSPSRPPVQGDSRPLGSEVAPVSPSPSPATSPSSPTVHVHIGRVVVRAEPSTAAQPTRPATAARPTQSLAEYLDSSKAGSR